MSHVYWHRGSRLSGKPYAPQVVVLAVDSTAGLTSGLVEQVERFSLQHRGFPQKVVVKVVVTSFTPRCRVWQVIASRDSAMCYKSGRSRTKTNPGFPEENRWFSRMRCKIRCSRRRGFRGWSTRPSCVSLAGPAQSRAAEHLGAGRVQRSAGYLRSGDCP